MKFTRPKKHQPAAKPPVETAGAFPVRFKLKGAKDGPVYQGQVVVVPCKGCGGPSAG